MKSHTAQGNRHSHTWRYMITKEHWCTAYRKVAPPMRQRTKIGDLIFPESHSSEVKKCMEYEVDWWRVPDQEVPVDQRGRGERLRKKTAEHKICVEDAMDCSRWKLIKTGWRSGLWVGGMFLLVPAQPGSPGQRAVKWLLLLLLLKAIPDSLQKPGHQM